MTRVISDSDFAKPRIKGSQQSTVTTSTEAMTRFSSLKSKNSGLPISDGVTITSVVRIGPPVARLRPGSRTPM